VKNLKYLDMVLSSVGEEDITHPDRDVGEPLLVGILITLATTG